MLNDGSSGSTVANWLINHHSSLINYSFVPNKIQNHLSSLHWPNWSPFAPLHHDGHHGNCAVAARRPPSCSSASAGQVTEGCVDFSQSRWCFWSPKIGWLMLVIVVSFASAYESSPLIVLDVKYCCLSSMIAHSGMLWYWPSKKQQHRHSCSVVLCWWVP